MLQLSIKFQCYIPKSLGKPLLDYFRNDPRINQLVNKDEFIRKLQSKDMHGYTWLPEPGGFLTGKYFATDTGEVHARHSDHTIRLGFDLNVDPKKIGNYKLTDRIFDHKNHGSDWGGHRSQHSGESHQVEAYIKRKATGYVDTGTTFIESGHEYVGVCSDSISTLRSEETPLKLSLENVLSRTYFHQAGTTVPRDTTVFIISASAGYPFAEPFSPNIDFEVKVKVIREPSGKSVSVQVDGWHNDFPAYELIIGNKVVYDHNPSDYNYTGPGYGNLTKSRNFKASLQVRS